MHTLTVLHKMNPENTHTGVQKFQADVEKTQVRFTWELLTHNVVFLYMRFANNVQYSVQYI